MECSRLECCVLAVCEIKHMIGFYQKDGERVLIVEQLQKEIR